MSSAAACCLSYKMIEQERESSRSLTTRYSHGHSALALQSNSPRLGGHPIHIHIVQQQQHGRGGPYNNVERSWFSPTGLQNIFFKIDFTVPC